MKNHIVKITLADCYHDSDKGGGGILAGALKIIEQVCAKHHYNPEISLLFRFSNDDTRFSGAARLTGKKFLFAKIVPAPISSLRGPGWYWFYWIINAFVVAPFKLLVPHLSKDPAIDALRDSDLILSKGGHFYRSWSKNPITDPIAILIIVFPLLLAIRLNRRFCLLSHSFGPFHSLLSRQIIRLVLGRASYISCREPISKDILIDCGLDPDRIFVTPDLAFSTYKASPDRTNEILAKYSLAYQEFIGVTARPWFYATRKKGRSETYRNYIGTMAALCDYLVENNGKRIALVVQNDGAHSVNEPDIGPLTEICEAMKNKQAAVIMDEDFSFDELTSIYASAFLTLGTRLHSCIFSLSVGTPAIAIAYSHKTPGIMRMAGAENFVLNIDDIDLEEGKRMIDYVALNRATLSLHYVDITTMLQRELGMMMEKIILEVEQIAHNND